MREYLLPQDTKQYKANLHSHSNISDGHLTPEEMAEAYHQHGYSVLAITDHEICREHSNLNREDFLLLTGYEYGIAELRGVTTVPFSRKHATHLCLLAKEPHNTKQVCYNPEYLQSCVPDKSMIAEVQYAGTPDFVKVYSPECLNTVIAAAREAGYLVHYNHPAWSVHNQEDYLPLQGLNAMEICNYSSFRSGLPELCPAVYDDMLRHGMRLGCLGTDDNHNAQPLDHPYSPSFGAFTMIAARELRYGAIIEALEKGDYYASRGPEIRELYVEDGTVHVKTSDARSVAFTTMGRRSKMVKAARGSCLNEASFALWPDDGYVRIEVTDHEGMTANTRAYFLDEMLEPVAEKETKK